MKKLKLKNKKILLIVVIAILVLLIAGTIVYTISISKNNKTIETMGEIIYNQEPENSVDNNVVENNIDETNQTNDVKEENKVTEDKNSTDSKKTTSTKEEDKYYIKVNNAANVVTIYTKDANGDYTVPVKAMVCSIGTATPTGGKYKLNGTKHRWHTLFGHTPGTYVYGQYTTAIVGNILFHSVPYTKKGNPSSLEYLEYDKLGTKASAGCIRLTVQDAKWIYSNISKGTTVEFYSDSNPGPLGKPSAQKISGNEACRNWDPTDTTQGNPWRNNTNKTQNTKSDTNKKQENKTINNVEKDTTKNNNKITNTTTEKNNIVNNVVEKNTVNNIKTNNVKSK